MQLCKLALMITQVNERKHACALTLLIEIFEELFIAIFHL